MKISENRHFFAVCNASEHILTIKRTIFGMGLNETLHGKPGNSLWGNAVLQKFLNDKSGAVTIDWVALSAAVLMVGIAALYAIYTNDFADLVKSVNSAMDTVGVGVSTGSAPGQSTFVQ